MTNDAQKALDEYNAGRKYQAFSNTVLIQKKLSVETDNTIRAALENHIADDSKKIDQSEVIRDLARALDALDIIEMFCEDNYDNFIDDVKGYRKDFKTIRAALEYQTKTIKSKTIDGVKTGLTYGNLTNEPSSNPLQLDMPEEMIVWEDEKRPYSYKGDARMHIHGTKYIRADLATSGSE